MRKLLFISVAVLLLLVVAGAAGLYVYDGSREDTIAAGVIVAGVDVGGLSAAEARTRVERRVADPLKRPIKVVYREKRFTLSAEDAGIATDVGGMIDDALAASREGHFFSRSFRDLTGGEEDEVIPPQVSYSKIAAARLVARVSKNVSRPARDASLNFPSLTAIKEQDGVAVREQALARRVVTALRDTTGQRTAPVPVKVTKAKVTRDELAQKYPTILVADRGSFQVHLYKNLKLQKSYTVAFGQAGYDTPTGLYNITNKAVDPAWSVPTSDWAGDLAGTVVPGGSPENPLKARWLGIYNGAGIHGTDDTGSLGTNASHGCIRMGVTDVIELYDQVPVSTPIYIG